MSESCAPYAAEIAKARSKNQQWSRELETECMNEQNIVCDQAPSLREKGGCKVCISHAKGSVVRQTMNRSINGSHGGKIVLSLKNRKDLPQDSKTKNGPVTQRRTKGEQVEGWAETPWADMKHNPS